MSTTKKDIKELLCIACLNSCFNMDYCSWVLNQVKVLKVFLVKRYTADKSITIEKKSAFMAGLAFKSKNMTERLKSLNNQAKLKTARNAEMKEVDGTFLAYNPGRLSEVLVHVLTSPVLKDMNKELLNSTPARIEKKFTMVTVRNFILSNLLLTGDGERPHAYTRMEVHELHEATITPDGSKVVRVKGHKTFAHHGVCPVPFIIQGLYEITIKFVETFG